MLTEYIFNSILLAIDFERSEYGNVLLCTIENTLDDDVCETNLLAFLQIVEEELQAASAFSCCATFDVVALHCVHARVVALGLDASLQFYGCSVRILPVSINLTVVSTEAVSLEANLRRFEGKAWLRRDEEAYCVIVSQVSIMLGNRLQTSLFRISISGLILDEPVASDCYLA